jgi:hypothetical protein
MAITLGVLTLVFTLRLSGLPLPELVIFLRAKFIAIADAAAQQR